METIYGNGLWYYCQSAFKNGRSLPETVHPKWYDKYQLIDCEKLTALALYWSRNFVMIR